MIPSWPPSSCETPAGDLALGFLIPMNEANRLARLLGLTRCAGVPVYGLVLGMLAQLRASLTRTVLDAEAEGIRATLVMEHEGSALPLPSHPADAIALALRTNAPIYATRATLAHACTLATHSGREPDRSQIARWLERVRPDDFSAADNREPWVSVILSGPRRVYVVLLMWCRVDDASPGIARPFRNRSGHRQRGPQRPHTARWLDRSCRADGSAATDPLETSRRTEALGSPFFTMTHRGDSDVAMN